MHSHTSGTKRSKPYSIKFVDIGGNYLFLYTFPTVTKLRKIF